jgi:S-DNA-T family DNA segregation ATPase FtsK/SpoIIIE
MDRMAARKSTRKSKPQTKAQPAVPAFLTRGEVGGVVLVFLSAITLLSLLTSSNGALTGAWLGWLAALFGIGLWGFPVVTGLLGLWMIVRAIENLPDLPWQRPAGVALLFLSLLVGATLLADAPGVNDGGEVGRVLTSLVAGALGPWGAWAFATFLAIAGFFLLADRLILEISQELSTLPQAWRARLQGEWQERRANSSIEPVVPLPSGQIAWWKRLQEQWRQSPPVADLPQKVSNLVRPQPETHRVEPTRPAAALAPLAAGSQVRPAPTAPKDAGLLTPRIVGGNAGQEWPLPRITDMLQDWERRADSDELIRQQGRAIQETLALFGVPADFEGAYKGPSVTQYLIKPGYVERTVQGEVKRIKVKVAKIAGLANDLALALAAPSVRIEAPIPGTNYVGVEVPNQEGNIVGLKELMESDTFQNIKGRLRIALGEDVKGQPITADLARMPHLLISGATGSGKSACINSIICCLLLTHSPASLRFLMVDPKMVELSNYNGVPHLLSPVVTEVDKAAGVLFWAVKEMERRYALLSKAGARDLVRYNDFLAKQNEKPLPYIVVIVDEMADLMMAAPEEVEKHICRLAQMARAVGIHLIIATQRPSVDVITGLIKANFPSRIAFAVTSQTDSRVVLDVPGAERLLGRGDMLFMAPDASKLERLQGTWVTDDEINRIIRYWKGTRTLDTPNSAATELSTDLSEPGPRGGVMNTTAPPPGNSEPPLAPPHVRTQRVPGAPRGEAPAEQTHGEASPPAPMTGLSQPPLFAEIAEMKKIDARDELFEEAVRVVEEAGRGSVNLLSRRLRIGYNRAARLVDQLEEAGILGPEQSGAQGRELLTAHTTRPSTTPHIIGEAPADPDDAGATDEDAPGHRIWIS